MDSTLDRLRDPELYDAQRILIKKMHGVSFTDATPLQKIGYVIPYILRFPFIAIGCAFLAAAACVVISVCAFDTGGLGCRGECEAARTASEISVSLLGGLAAAVFLTVRSVWRRESEIRRLRKLPPSEFLHAMDYWEQEKDSLARILARYDDIEYAAQRTAYWNDRYAQRHVSS